MIEIIIQAFLVCTILIGGGVAFFAVLYWIVKKM